ncbi:MAG TPA: hypothetical protein VFH48_06810, partial [Chloroflexota bacterium]|nr:hypothetical protein [Chloroflexota bacterium]
MRRWPVTIIKDAPAEECDSLLEFWWTGYRRGQERAASASDTGGREDGRTMRRPIPEQIVAAVR